MNSDDDILILIPCMSDCTCYICLKSLHGRIDSFDNKDETCIIAAVRSNRCWVGAQIGNGRSGSWRSGARCSRRATAGSSGTQRVITRRAVPMGSAPRWSSRPISTPSWRPSLTPGAASWARQGTTVSSPRSHAHTLLHPDAAAF